jgi:hypothetical protein
MFVNTVNKGKGDVAQLARALDWQSRGRRFEPDLLHVIKASKVYSFEAFYFKT